MTVAARTTLTPDEARTALLHAWRQVFDGVPTADQLSLLMGQSAFETRHWRSMFDFNFGNLRFRADAPTNAFWDGAHADNPGDGDPYRSYPDAFKGAGDYVRLLASRPDWRTGLLSGNPAVFADALGGLPPRYHETDPARYAEILASTAKRYGNSHVAPKSSGMLLGLLAVGIGVFAWLRR